jgi:hypothetical protein
MAYGMPAAPTKVFQLSIALVLVLAVNIFLSSIQDFADPVRSRNIALAAQGTTRVIFSIFLLAFSIFTLVRQESSQAPIFFAPFIALGLIILGSSQLQQANKGFKNPNAIPQQDANGNTIAPPTVKDKMGLVIGSLHLIMGVAIGVQTAIAIFS